MTTATTPAPATELELEERLTRPTAGVLETLRRHPGDVLVLGAGGKMGATLAGMLVRGLKDIGRSDAVIAVSRYSDPDAEAALHRCGARTLKIDLAEHRAVEALPDAPNVFFMAGQKFGTTGAPAITWGTNVVVPAIVAARFGGARFVAFSTGNVYPLRPVADGGARESDPLAPVGEYAISCLARERVLEFSAIRHGVHVSILRLNYAVDLRYGVLVDLARRIVAGEPIDLTMGFVNVIWQGDACAWAIQSLGYAAAPPFVLNVTGPETLPVRDIAERLGERLGRTPRFDGAPARDALLSDASLARELFGPPSVDAMTLIDWAADWVGRGGRTLGKPTHFEMRDGRF